MKKLIFLLTFLLLFLTFENSFAQTQTAEENENFSGIIQWTTLNGYIPIINWPVEFAQDSNMYIVEFAVLSASSKNISSFPASRNGSITVP